MINKSTDCDADLSQWSTVWISVILRDSRCIKTNYHYIYAFVIELVNCTRQHWSNISATVHNKHAVRYDTQKRRPMSGVSNGLWTIKLTGSSVLPVTPCIPQDPQQDFSLFPLQKRPKKQQWLHAGQTARGWWWQTVVQWALTHHADRAAAGAPGQAGSRGSHRGPDSPERGTLRAERPDSAAPAPRGLTGHRAERCKGGSE